MTSYTTVLKSALRWITVYELRVRFHIQ